MDTAWTWELSDHCAKYSFLTESKGLTMREVERIFQLDPEPPVLENMNDYIIEAVRSRELRWFSLYYRVVVFRAPLQGPVLHCKGCCGLVWFSYRKTVRKRLQPQPFTVLLIS